MIGLIFFNEVPLNHGLSMFPCSICPVSKDHGVDQMILDHSVPFLSSLEISTAMKKLLKMIWILYLEDRYLSKDKPISLKVA
jgi:hypothetical protein